MIRPSSLHTTRPLYHSAMPHGGQLNRRPGIIAQWSAILRRIPNWPRKLAVVAALTPFIAAIAAVGAAAFR